MTNRAPHRVGQSIPVVNLTRRRFGGLALAAGLMAASHRQAAACQSKADQIQQVWPELFFDLPLDGPQSAARHTLNGRVWSAQRPWSANTLNDCGFDTNSSDLKAAIAQADIVCFGEVHDNTAHHIFRAHFANARSGNVKPRAAVFEQIRADQQPALDTFAALAHPSTDDLLKALDWEHSPWSKTADYRPLFDAAVSNQQPVYAGDPPRDVIHKAARQGLAQALLPGEIARLALDTPLGEANETASLKEIEDSHCGAIPKSAHAGMAQAQRYRDAYMADALIRSTGAHGAAILFAGNGHVRTDRGVPWYIAKRKPDATLVSIMLIEVEDGQTDPEAYVPRDPAGNPATGYIVFTPRSHRDDPCANMKPPK